jgi:P27 family predicted phage terminase small subunit
MNDFEKQNYFEVCELLISVGLLTLADLSAIITYVKTLNIQREAFAELERNGVFVMQMDGSYKESRAVNVVATCTKALKDFWGRFGFTPADRERLSMGITKQPEKGEFD